MKYGVEKIAILTEDELHQAVIKYLAENNVDVKGYEVKNISFFNGYTGITQNHDFTKVKVHIEPTINKKILPI